MVRGSMVAGALAAGLVMTSCPVSAASCGGLWYARNAIYKEGGYCFNTPRGIRSFGNAGCQYDDVADVPLSARQRATVVEIQREERYLGCSR